ncbi:DUF3105 domain-containing protein [Glycomyces halotolerans]
MASKKKTSPTAGRKSGGKGRAVQVKQPKPWGLIITFSVVGVVALGLIAVAAFVVWDRSRPPEGDVVSYYAPYEDYASAQEALSSGEITAEDLEHPWVLQQGHVDADEDPANDTPTYEITPPAGGNHLSAWQTCSGVVYDDPIADGNAVHSLEHGAVWLTYDPEIAGEDEVAELASKVEGRDFSFMSPYPGQGVKISLQSWGNQYQTEDVDDPNIDQFLNHFIQNADYAAEMGATCSDGVTTTTADAAGDTQMTEEEYQELLDQMEESAPEEGAEGEG